MLKFLIRLVSLLLVFCLIADPATATRLLNNWVQFTPPFSGISTLQERFQLEAFALRDLWMDQPYDEHQRSEGIRAAERLLPISGDSSTPDGPVIPALSHEGAFAWQTAEKNAATAEQIFRGAARFTYDQEAVHVEPIIF